MNDLIKLLTDIYIDISTSIHDFAHALYINPVPSVAGFGVVVSLLAAWLGLNTNRDIAKKRATLDLILGEQTNSKIFDKRQKFLFYRDGKKKLESYLKIQKKDITKSRNPFRNKEKQKAEIEEAREAIDCITASINRYEMIAIGIEKKCICEEMYKEWLRSTVINDWKTVENFVCQLRVDKNIPTLYQRFELMALRFSAPDNQQRSDC